MNYMQVVQRFVSELRKILFDFANSITRLDNNFYGVISNLCIFVSVLVLSTVIIRKSFNRLLEKPKLFAPSFRFETIFLIRNYEIAISTSKVMRLGKWK